MSGFACLYFQEPWLLQFQKEREDTFQQNNLRTLFGVQEIPKTKALKERVDAQDSNDFNPLFKGIANGLTAVSNLNNSSCMTTWRFAQLMRPNITALNRFTANTAWRKIKTTPITPRAINILPYRRRSCLRTLNRSFRWWLSRLRIRRVPKNRTVR